MNKCIYCKFYRHTMERTYGDYGEVLTFKCPVCTAPWGVDKIRNGKCVFFILNRDYKMNLKKELVKEQ